MDLSQAERAQMTALLSGGKCAARKLKRAQILLAADVGASDAAIVRPGPSRTYPAGDAFL